MFPPFVKDTASPAHLLPLWESALLTGTLRNRTELKAEAHRGELSLPAATFFYSRNGAGLGSTDIALSCPLPAWPVASWLWVSLEGAQPRIDLSSNRKQSCLSPRMFPDQLREMWVQYLPQAPGAQGREKQCPGSENVTAGTLSSAYLFTGQRAAAAHTPGC